MHTATPAASLTHTPGLYLPPSGVIRVYVTGDMVTDESAAHGDAAARGWAYRVGARDLYDSRNDVSPALEIRLSDTGAFPRESWHDSQSEADSDARGEIERILQDLGAYSTDDGSTLYGQDSHILDYSTDETYTYALHAHVKHYTAAGYVETPVDLLALAGHRD